MGKRKTSRLFFALYPEKAERQQIQAADYPKLKSNPVPPENWHITLVYLGACSDSEQARFIRAADVLRAEPFEFVLDTTGQFMHAQVAWLGCHHCPEALRDLHRKLVTSLRQACPAFSGLSTLLRPYVPHLTLYRNIKQPYDAVSISPVLWRVNRFHLLESCRAGRPVYRSIKSWCLGA